MESYGINIPFLLAQLVNLALLCIAPTIWIVLAALALRSLRLAALDDTARAIWAAIIVAVPVLGAIAYYLVRPGTPSPQ